MLPLGLALEYVREEAVAELRIVYEVLEIEGYFGGVQVAHFVVLLELLQVVLFQESRRLLRARVVVEGREVVIIVHYHRFLGFVAVNSRIWLIVLLIIVHLG